jgi:D-cysteine desulfhydrase
MTNPDLLQKRFPGLLSTLPRVPMARLPTSIEEVRLDANGRRISFRVKADNQTGESIGGNKIRKLEYLFGSIDRAAIRRVATYGTVASNHALATALMATELGLESTCFLSHQARTGLARRALGWQLKNGTELVPFSGSRAERLDVQRKYLWGRGALVVAPGGSSWRGTAGFVNAGLEIADQVAAGVLPCPDRIYMAAGTMGSVAGLAIGLAVAGLPSRVVAVRVSHEGICNAEGLVRLCKKTCTMLHRGDREFPQDAWERINVELRHEFFLPGYARASQQVADAIATVESQCDLVLEPTYTGKAMAALLADAGRSAQRGEQQLFWNTFHSMDEPGTIDRERVPEALHRYLD